MSDQIASALMEKVTRESALSASQARTATLIVLEECFQLTLRMLDNPVSDNSVNRFIVRLADAIRALGRDPA